MPFDPIYFVFMIPGILLSMWASARVKSAFAEYSQVGTANNLSGAEAAQHLLQRAGINDVRVIPTQGFLSDHYNPTDKTLALSEATYHSRSVAAVGVAAHEAGHALQHAARYSPLHLRSALVPTVSIGSTLGLAIMGFGLMIHPYVVVAGAILFSAVLLFQIVTLPVEFDATARAKRLVVEAGIIHPEERKGMDKVLNAAALTYVAAVVGTLFTMLYYLFRSGLFGGRREE